MILAPWHINYIFLLLRDLGVTQVGFISKNQTGTFIHFIIPYYDGHKNEQFNCYFIYLLSLSVKQQWKQETTAQIPVLEIPTLYWSQHKKHIGFPSDTSERASYLYLLSVSLLVSTGHIIVLLEQKCLHNSCSKNN